MVQQWLELIDFGTLLFHGALLLAAFIWLPMLLAKRIRQERRERKKRKFHVISGGKIKRVS
ncbi:hypothetical protein ACNQFZ_02685 [Schinkia sp. CFF1]